MSVRDFDPEDLDPEIRARYHARAAEIARADMLARVRAADAFAANMRTPVHVVTARVFASPADARPRRVVALFGAAFWAICLLFTVAALVGWP